MVVESVCLSLLLRAHNESPTLLASSKRNYLLNTSPPKTISLGVRAPTYELREWHIQSITTLANEWFRHGLFSNEDGR